LTAKPLRVHQACLFLVAVVRGMIRLEYEHVRRVRCW
jgi:hypothetical protein